MEENKKIKSTVRTKEESQDWKKKIQDAKEKKQKEAVEEQIPSVTEDTVKESPVEKKEPEEKPQSVEDTFDTYFNPNVGQTRVNNAPYIPTEEEKSREEAYMAVKDGDASSLIHEINGCGEDIDEISAIISRTREQNKKLTKEEILANKELSALYDCGAQLRAALEDSESFGSQKKLLMSMIDALNRHDVYLKRLDKKLSIAKITSELSGKPKVYKGKDAIQLINSRYRGVYKIQLPNSGFWMKLIPMTPANMDAWLHEVDYNYKQIGRLIGGHFYLGFGVYLKQKLVDLLMTGIVVDTNLAGWRDGTTLVDSISIHDYDVICWAISTMMHKNGISISTTCTNPECMYHSTEQYIDLARCFYTNPEVLTKEAEEFLIAGNAPGVLRTKEQLKEYRTKLLRNKKFITFKDHDQLELVEPTLGEYIRTGMNVLGKLAASVKDGKLDITDEEVQRKTAFQLTTMFSAWVKSIILKNNQDAVQAVIDDQEAISYQLETIMAEKNDFVKSLEEFMTTSKVSFFAYVNAKCPKCGRQPDLLKDNLSTLDMEYVLFCLSYLKLGQIGPTL